MHFIFNLIMISNRHITYTHLSFIYNSYECIAQARHARPAKQTVISCCDYGQCKSTHAICFINLDKFIIIIYLFRNIFWQPLVAAHRIRNSLEAALQFNAATAQILDRGESNRWLPLCALPSHKRFSNGARCTDE